VPSESSILREVILLGRKIGISAVLWIALEAWARAQTFGVGGSVGLVNDASIDFTLDRFKHSEVTGWFDYQFEKNSLLRFTYGSMRTTQTNSEQTVDTPGGPLALPLMKERVGYVTVGVAYMFWEGYFTSGLIGGIGGYGFRPDAVASDFAQFGDRKETVFGWHFGTEAVFRVYKNFGIVGRLTYHNVSAHPHRQFVNADAGLVARF
jgi:hypothetical protein